MNATQQAIMNELSFFYGANVLKNSNLIWAIGGLGAIERSTISIFEVGMR